MYRGMSVGAVIPARDEEDNIADVVADLLRLRAGTQMPIVAEVVVCDNGSADATASRARAAGARVVHEPTPGYGAACLAALAALKPVDAVLFVDGDQAFDVRQSLRLLDALAEGADLAIGSRAHGRMEKGALTAPQIVGNRVAGALIRLFWGQRVSDLGPFRAIRTGALRQLEMQDRAYGWTVEMQVKAIQRGLCIVEKPVDSLRRRHGASKVGGTVAGVIGASAGILGMIARLRFGNDGARQRPTLRKSP